jgi:drug/metabolite transporter (DMT)-like permease
MIRKEGPKLVHALNDRRGMLYASLATITGPFIGVSLSLMAVQYTNAGIASTIMALTPVLIILPSYLIFKQKVKVIEVIGAFISIAGVSLFFL